MMKIALAQINPTIGAYQKNAVKILAFIERAKKKKADLVVFPELSLVGYPPLDLLDKDHFVEDNLKYLKTMALNIKGIAALVGFIDKNKGGKGKSFLNAAALIYNGKIISTHYKSLLPSYDVFDETRHFEPAKKVKGSILKGQKIAVSICEDIWNDKDFWKKNKYQFDPIAQLLRRKNACHINLSASPYSIGKMKLRHEMLKNISKKYKTPSIYVNQVGSNDDLIFDGGSFAVDAKGKVIAQCKDFKEDLVMLNLDDGTGDIHPLSTSEAEATTNALTLGIKDYADKCGFKKVLIGLSGGIDSALTATLACKALGPKNVIGVTMPSKYSSKGSVDDSKKLSKNLKMKCLTIPIHKMYETYLEAFNPIFRNSKITLTEENLQARIRGNILMSFSNQWHALLLSTGNKSELAMGYCTLYGDMSGGLGVLSDLPKTMVYKIAAFINKTKTIIPKSTITKAPSAELRPNQKDQDSLPDYNLLDKILKAYVVEHKPIKKIKKMGYSEKLIKDLIMRVDLNEYKRRQAPVGLRVTTKAFGLGRRLPITQRYTELVEE